MNYIKEINSFYDWLETNPLASSCIVLWYALMHIANKAGWPDTFAVAVSVLEIKTGLKKDTIYDARNKLQQAGRIKWNSRRGNQSAVYKIISFENESKKPTQVPTQPSTQVPTQPSMQSSTINKLNETKLNETIAEEDRGTPSAASTAVLYDDRYRSIVEAYEANIRPITPLEAERLSKWLDDMDADVIIAAIEEAIVYNKRSMKYIEGILRNWHSNNIRTKLDLEAYRRDWEDRKQSEGQASRDLNKTVDFARFEHHEYTDEQLESLFEEIG
jgi:DnaD/phage-associated family protein